VKGISPFLSAALLTPLLSGAAFAANPPKEFRPPEKRPLPVDILQATAFEAQPSAVRAGEPLKLTLTIRNVSNTVLAAVPWAIEEPALPGSVPCGRGTRANVAANETFQVSCTARPAAGRRTFRGVADPDGTLGEPAGGPGALNFRLNNSREVAVTVMTPGAIAATEAWLDPQRARHAAQGLAMVMSSRSGAPPRGPGCSLVLEPGTDHIRFGVDCRKSPQGDRLNFLLYRGFDLKNGWMVDHVETPDLNSASPDRGSRINVAPAPGSTRPYTEIHSYAVPFNFKFDVVKIKIRGPFGTDPYE